MVLYFNKKSVRRANLYKISITMLVFLLHKLHLETLSRLIFSLSFVWRFDLNNFRWTFSFRWNLTANAARPNPQGSFHYGKITPSKTFIFANSAPIINGKQRYAVNGMSYINPDTPLKLADYYNIPGVFSMSSLKASPSGGAPSLATSALPTNLHDFIEVIFQNNEDTLQSWHLDGYDFWVVGYEFF